jgi:hypothetical protein
MSEAALMYLGGAFIHGVPARNLTADEAAQYGDLIREQEEVTHTQMYAPVPASAPKVSKAAKEPTEVSNG